MNYPQTGTKKGIKNFKKLFLKNTSLQFIDKKVLDEFDIICW